MEAQYIEVDARDKDESCKVLINTNYLAMVTSSNTDNTCYISFIGHRPINAIQSYDDVTKMIRDISKDKNTKSIKPKTVNKTIQPQKVSTLINFMCEDKYVHQFDYLDLIKCSDKKSYPYLCEYIKGELILRYSNNKYLTNDKRAKLNPLDGKIHLTANRYCTDYSFKISKLVWQNIEKQIKEIIELIISQMKMQSITNNNYSEHDPIFELLEEFKKDFKNISDNDLDEIWLAVNGFKFSDKYGEQRINKNISLDNL